MEVMKPDQVIAWWQSNRENIIHHLKDNIGYYIPFKGTELQAWAMLGALGDWLDEHETEHLWIPGIAWQSDDGFIRRYPAGGQCNRLFIAITEYN
jgi:hypothetical protein